MRERIRLRRDSALNWSTNNPILASGEPGVEIDSNRLKIGNGVTRWNNLQYLVADSSLSNLIIGDGNFNAIHWSPPDRLNIVGSGGTSVIFDDTTNTVSINVPVSVNNNNIANFTPGITPSGLPIITSVDGLTVATGISSTLVSDFKSAVSGLLPSVSGSGYVLSSFSNNSYTISVTGLQPSGNYITNISGSTGIFVSNDGSTYTISVTGIVGGAGNSNVTISNYGNNRVLTSDGSISGIYAENGLLFDGHNLTISSGLLATTGNFSSGLFVSGIPVSVSGHTHLSSQITNFDSAVSGLLPVKNILPGNNVSISNNNGNFTINANGGGGGDPSSNINAVRGSFVLTAPSSIFNVSNGYTIGSLDVFLNGVKLSSLGDYDASNGTSFSLTEPAPSGSIIEYLALVPGVALPAATASSAISEFFHCGRLSLSSNDPLADSIASSDTIYFLPYFGNIISLYYNNQWQSYSFNPLSLPLNNLSVGRIYDIFIYHLGNNNLALETTGWQNNSNVRSVPLIYKDGILVNSSNLEKRYLGTFTATTLNTTSDSSSRRLLFNANNQIFKHLIAEDSGSAFIYTSSITRVYRNLSSLGVTQAQFTNGLSNSILNIICISNFITETSSSSVGVGLDTTTSINTQAFNRSTVSSGPALIMQNTAMDIAKPDIGFHTLSLLQSGSSDSTFNSASMKVLFLC